MLKKQIANSAPFLKSDHLVAFFVFSISRQVATH